MYEIIRKYPWCSLWFVFLAATFLASIFVLNPILSGAGPVSWPQLELQFAYWPEKGISVLEHWGAGSKDRYLGWIWIDILFALSYGPFFYMLLKNCGASRIFYLIPIVEMITNLIETSMEIYWVQNHTSTELMTGLFLTHSIIATIKWSLVPIYLVHSVVLIGAWFQQKSTAAIGEAS